jgi:tocopherol O-methyltransferase
MNIERSSTYDADESSISEQNLKIMKYYNAIPFPTKNLAIHLGYYDETVRTYEDSLIRMNWILAETAQVRESDLVLDAGCGVGGSSIWLALTFGCKVKGITLVRKQLELANSYAVERHIDDHTEFKIMDFTNTEFDDETFDVVWALESICHTIRKENFVHEAHRILKKSGRLIMADLFMNKDQLTHQELKKMKWISGWAIPDLCHKDTFRKYMEDVGFRNITFRDISANVIPSSKIVSDRGNIGLNNTDNDIILSSLSQEDRQITSSHLQAVVDQYPTLREGLWCYAMYYARK